MKHGIPFAKNRIILTHKNLIERAATFFRYKLKKQLGSTLLGTFCLCYNLVNISALWILLIRQGGMEYTRASTLWKCMMQPDTVNMDDMTQFFFEYTNPRSRLANLGRQRLAIALNEAQEGAQCDYVVSGNNFFLYIFF